MDVSHFVALHITAGTFALVSGGAAMLVRKGAAVHRFAGSVFFVAMLVMCASAIPVAIVRDQSLNVAAASLTIYLVLTAWVAAARKDSATVAFEAGAALVGLAIAAVAGLEGQASTNGAGPFLLGFASIAGFAALLDVSVVLRGGVSGAQRIARHLWRMSFAMAIATLSFFIGQAKFLPAIVRETQLNLVPPLLVVALLLFWLARVLFTRWYRTDADGSPHEQRTALARRE